jgi:ribose/xylose/arabinose/galactoside ABC-type transport system permease subunit
MPSVADRTTTPEATIPESREAGDGVTASGLHARLLRRRLAESSITVFAFLGFFAAFGIWLGGRFLNVDARLLDVHNNAPILLLGLAVLVTMVPGMFDLSVAGVATLTCFLAIGLRVQQGLSFPLVLIITLAVGALVGLINAFVVERLKVHAFIATLGTGAICDGLASVYSHGTVLIPGTIGAQLPNWFQTFGLFTDKAPEWLVGTCVAVAAATLFFALDYVRPELWNRTRWLTAKAVLLAILAALLVFVFRLSRWLTDMSWMTLVLLLIGLAIWVLLDYTTYGRHARAIGSNRAAARLAGVKAQRQVVKSFVLGSTLAALAGVFLAATQGSATPGVADPFLLPAFAAAFLSTVVFSHGRFTVPGTIIGGVFVVWIGQALIVGGISASWIPAVNGAILVGAVALSTTIRRRS